MSSSLQSTLLMSCEMTDVLCDIERAGIKIDRQALIQLKEDFENEQEELRHKLRSMAQAAMGDTPINLDSPDDRSALFYSRKVNNKQVWKTLFNLGTEQRGATKKQKMRTRMKQSEFKHAVSDNTTVIRRTIGSQCMHCEGTGRVSFTRKDGSISKAKRICSACNGKGITYVDTGKTAGFKISPRGVADVAAGGFKTDKETLEQRLDDLSGEAKEFVAAYIRYSAIRTYLSNFVDGMFNNLDHDDFIHPEFMQCVTATGRLSSRNPNFQNMPRGSTFVIRKVVKSRWEGGKILEGDYSQLEFRVAGFLSSDESIYNDVKAGTDVHSYTAEIIGCSRQEAKAHTFKPLYGGVTGTDSQKRYYNAFKDKYAAVTNWQDEMQRQAVDRGYITLPSGRQYHFPGTKWTKWGTATNRTAICNYPVQGFATGDLLPLALIHLSKLLRQAKINSVICNTVHDSIVMDVYPGEESKAISMMEEAMLSIKDESHRRYGIHYDMPVDIELKIGDNWLDTELVEP